MPPRRHGPATAADRRPRAPRSWFCEVLRCSIAGLPRAPDADRAGTSQPGGMANAARPRLGARAGGEHGSRPVLASTADLARQGTTPRRTIMSIHSTFGSLGIIGTAGLVIS